MSFYETFVFLCDEACISLSSVAQMMEIDKSTVAAWKKLDFSSGNDAMNKVSDFFGVSMDFLSEKTGVHNCAGCGLEYDRFKSDIAHTKRHEQWLLAISKYGFCWNHHQREIRNELREKVMNTNLPFKERYNFYVSIIKAYFSRSVESSNYNFSHPEFNEYAAMYLNNEHDDCPKDIYEALTSRYGVKEGMDGTYYFVP